MSGPEITLSEAVISQDERHRYSLTRRWGDGPRVCCWIMLNPSTADATTDDPTIRRCIGFTHDWGYDALTVVNLYAWRATDPADLRNAQRAGRDVVGGLNDEHILANTDHARLVIAAWGAHAATMPDRRDERVLNLLRRRPIHCLGTNRDGSPKHPVRLRADTPRHLYRSPS